MIYIVTGISRGLGFAIAKELLDKRLKVIGIGRSNRIQHPNLQFIKCDLSSSKDREALKFEEFTEPVTLINNAGILGEIGRVSQMKSISNLAEVLEVNTIAPLELTKKIYSAVKNKENFTLVNVSSGAANRSIPSWAAYCASKAALNMLSEIFYLEELELGNYIKVYAVAPGVIDTGMQEQIRSTNQNDFSSVNKFVELKNNGELFSPEEAAKRLLNLLELKYTGDVFYDLRTINN